MTSNSMLQTAAVAVAASVVTAGAILLVQRKDKQKRIQELKKDIYDSIPSTANLSPLIRRKIDIQESRVDEGLVREQLSRNYAFLGEQGVADVRKAFVIVVGLGGVGSHAAHMLLRSGVEHLRLIDFDQVSLSSLNRHAVATQADVGVPKGTCLKNHFEEIAPHAKIDVKNELFNLAAADHLLKGKPDYVLDCIDNLNTKMDLIKYCVDHKIKIISSMGAGAKADPSRIQIADISETFEDPLARATRRGLKLKGVESGVTVVYSTEKPGPVKLLPLEETKVDNADEYSALPDFRVRILPVLGTLPALFGMCMASYVTTELAKWPTMPLAIKLRDKTYMRLHRDLVNKEKDQFKSSDNLPLNVADIGYIFEEIWRGRSALSGGFDKLHLTRWDVSKPASFQNLICLTRGEVEKHEKLTFDQLPSYYSEEFLKFVNERFKEERKINKWR
ncbi:hypothetical protein DFS34DRAFT_653873 [Phlyctochytrium arcticum]|nr:hypothetical protein DFS34DRAFT_653873 [Phlyctochytrium arcticum]